MNELNDKINIELIKKALEEYKDGALVEACSHLEEVVQTLHDFINEYSL